MCLIPLLKKHFFDNKRDTSLSSRNTNRYRILFAKSIKEKDKNWLQSWVYIIPVAFTTSVFSASGWSGYRCMALGRCEGSRRFPAVCSRLNSSGGCGCCSCMAQVSGSGPHTTVSYDFYKSHAFIVARIVFCCTKTMWMLQSADIIYV